MRKAVGSVLMMIVFALQAQSQVAGKAKSKAASVPGSPAEVALPIPKFLEAQEKLFESSDSRTLLARKEKAADLTEKIAVSYDPWSITNQTKAGTANKLDAFSNIQNTTTLSYETPFGVAFQTYARVAEPAGSAGSSYQGTSRSAGASVGYEFNKTGRQYELTERSAAVQKVATKLEARGSYLDQRESYILGSLALYVQHCKLRDKQNLEGLVLQTLKIAEVQLAAKSIDIQDYIRINDLYLSFQRDIQSTWDQIYQSERSLLSVTPSGVESIKSLATVKIDCETMLNESQELAAPAEKKYDATIKMNSSLSYLRRRNDLAQLQSDAYLNKGRSSLEVKTGVDITDDRVAGQKTENLFVGLNWSYAFKEKSYEYQRINLNREIQDIVIQTRVTEDSLRTKISQLTDSMRSLSNFSIIAKKSYANALKGLEVTKMRQDLGMINANNIYSAYSNYASAIAALRDVWQNYRFAEFRIQTLEKNAEGSKALQDDSETDTAAARAAKARQQEFDFPRNE